jgi:hypothetical protein
MSHWTASTNTRMKLSVQWLPKTSTSSTDAPPPNY